jgi:hypothetical protein
MAFEYDYEYMADQVIENIQWICEKNNVPVPNIFTEFGSLHGGRKRRGALLGTRPEAPERQGVVVHDRRFVHHASARRVGAQPEVHHDGRQQLGQPAPQGEPGRA